MAKRIFNIIVWIGTACVVAAVGIWALSLTRPLPAGFDQYRFYLAITGLVCMLIYMAGQWREVGTVLSGRQARYGTLSATSVLIVLGILIAINYIGKQQNKRWDLTAAKQFSISDQSRNVLAKLDAPLQIQVFEQSTGFQTFQDRLKEYEYASSQVKTEYIDPQRDPSLAVQNKVTNFGTLIFNYKGRSERITSSSEQDITNAIIKVVSGQQRKVYFTQGHGEKDPTGSDRDSYSGIAELLKRENYLVERLVTAQVPAIPDDATVIVVAGPRNDFFPQEVDLLKKYLDKQGKLLLLLDPPDKADAAPLPNLVALAQEWGIEVGSNLVVDISGMGRAFGASEGMPVAAKYPAHPITDRFEILTMYPLARSVTPVSGGVNGRTAQPVVETSDRSWAESNLKGIYSNQQSEMNAEAGDKAGPVTVAAAVSLAAPAPTPDPAKPDPEADAPKPETRVAVFGDSDFAANSFAGFAGNKDLFMNAVGWLSQQESLISIRPKEPDDRRLTMTAGQKLAMRWFSWFLVPGAVIAAGVFTWWRRR